MVTPLDAIDLDGSIIPPDLYAQRLRGATVKVNFILKCRRAPWMKKAPYIEGSIINL